MEIFERPQRPQKTVETRPSVQPQHTTNADLSAQVEKRREIAKPSEDRIVLLTDGIFAIALTLLVLGIQVPSASTFNSAFTFDGDFFTNTRNYLITFAVLFSYWRVHRRLLNNLERIDNPFILLNAVFLAFVAFFPVTNGLLKDSQFPIAVIIYTVVLAGCGYSAALLVIYAFGKNRLVAADNDFHSPQALIASTTLTPTFFLLTLLLLLIPHFDSGSIFYYWLLLPIAFRIYPYLKRSSDKSA